MGIEAPTSIRAKLDDLNGIFHKIVSAAENPHLHIPKTEAPSSPKTEAGSSPTTETGSSSKQVHRLINQSLMLIFGMTFFNIPSLKP